MKQDRPAVHPKVQNGAGGGHVDAIKVTAPASSRASESRNCFKAGKSTRHFSSRDPQGPTDHQHQRRTVAHQLSRLFVVPRNRWDASEMSGVRTMFELIHQSNLVSLGKRVGLPAESW